MATHSSTLAWRIPRTEEPGGLQFMGSQSWKQQKQLSTAHISSNSDSNHVCVFSRVNSNHNMYPTAPHKDPHLERQHRYSACGKRKCYNCVSFWMGILLIATRNWVISGQCFCALFASHILGNSSQGPEGNVPQISLWNSFSFPVVTHEFGWEEIVTWRTLWGTRKLSPVGVGQFLT